MDVSGSMQRAGGVVSVRSGDFSLQSASYPTYDGNGNVIDAQTTGPKSAEYKYKFSTKPQDTETNYLYYGYRYYNPVTGKWPSRDAIQERGGINLYGFVKNNGVNYIDFLGMQYGSEIK